LCIVMLLFLVAENSDMRPETEINTLKTNFLTYFVDLGVQLGCARKQKTPQTLSLRGFESSP